MGGSAVGGYMKVWRSVMISWRVAPFLVGTLQICRAAEDIFCTHPVVVSSQQEVNFIVILRSDEVYRVDQVIDGFVLKGAPWGDVDGGHTDPPDSL